MNRDSRGRFLPPEPPLSLIGVAVVGLLFALVMLLIHSKVIERALG